VRCRVFAVKEESEKDLSVFLGLQGAIYFQYKPSSHVVYFV